MVRLTRATVIGRLYELQHDSLDYLDEEDLQDFESFDNEALASAYCGSGLFQHYHEDNYENELVIE